ncbi:MAG TPA: SH3 domain-containing protein [Chloroflexota bacterium]|nr:SH3 domain-containing protein [Chloroflexota bacterium]
MTAVTTVWVGNTDGGGVYLRNSPHDGDRADVLPDGTPLTVTGDEVEGDGQRWYPVKTPDGTEGYVQVIYTTRTQPTATPTPSGAPPK